MLDQLPLDKQNEVQISIVIKDYIERNIHFMTKSIDDKKDFTWKPNTVQQTAFQSIEALSNKMVFMNNYLNEKYNYHSGPLNFSVYNPIEK